MQKIIRIYPPGGGYGGGRERGEGETWGTRMTWSWGNLFLKADNGDLIHLLFSDWRKVDERMDVINTLLCRARGHRA